MTRAVIVLRTDADRKRAAHWAVTAPVGTRVEWKAPRRSLPQNSRFWAMLTDVSMQARHFGRSYPPDVWKVIFMHALGRENKFVPSLDGDGVVPTGFASSELSVAEMSELMEFISAWAAQNGITLHDETEFQQSAEGGDHQARDAGQRDVLREMQVTGEEVGN